MRANPPTHVDVCGNFRREVYIAGGYYGYIYKWRRLTIPGFVYRWFT